jgi:Starch-binding associating with outer membrane
MKLKNIIIIPACLLLVLAGCKKSWLNVNTNPNSLPSSTPDYTFAAGANRIAANLGPNEIGSYWSGQWTQSSTYIISNTIFQYQFNNTNFNYWDGYYDILTDLEYSIKNAADKGLPYFGGTARVLKAYVYQIMVDMYGNIPYKEALKGVDGLAPKFDPQKDIYEDLIKQLDTAITILKSSTLSAAYVGSDIVFGGGGATTAPTKWVQFANSLKLRILIRQSRIAGRDAYITTEINKAAAVTEGFLPSGLDVTSNPGYVASTGKLNPFYETWGYNAAGGVQSLGRYPRPTVFLFNSLISKNDTFRLKRLAWPKGGEAANNPEILTNYVAVPFGISSGYLSQNTSYIGPSQIKKGEFNRPMILMTNAEVQFLLAEAKQRYGAGVTLPNTAQAYYEQGVKESFRITGTTAAYGAATATTLLTSGLDLADWTASPDKLKAIWMQKWLALTNYSGFEAWSEFRRTNFPVTPPSASTAANAPLPLRLFYPQPELASNGENVTAQGTIDVFTTRIFWDVD